MFRARELRCKVVPIPSWSRLTYEPTWASLSGDESKLRLSARILNDTCSAIRKILTNLFGPQAGEDIRILFGGGVTENSAEMLLQELPVDGLLIGRAGANIASFLHILEAAEESMHRLKYIMRHMFGRATFDLLKARVLNAI